MKPLILGETNFRNQHKRFGILPDDRRRHCYALGKSGCGKSVLLENMIIQDIQNGHGVCVLDPHGDMAENLLKYIPKNRINDCIFFNPCDTEYPISWNPMEKTPETRVDLIASAMVTVFKKMFKLDGQFSAPQLEHILRNALFAVVEAGEGSLLNVKRILLEESFRKRIVSKIKNTEVREFWTKEFPEHIMKRRDDPISSTLNKVGQFLTVPLLKNILSQKKSSFQMRQAMDEGKIIICNLSKGRIGEDIANLLGSLLIAKISIDAMSRADIPESERRDYFLYVDEFASFATDSFSNILSEARKYRLSLILAHQYIDQLNDSVKSAVFGNCGTMIAFRVGATDAEFLEKEFYPFSCRDLISLEKYHVIIRLMIDGLSGDAFSATTLPPQDCSDTACNFDKIIRVSRERYAKPRNVIEGRNLTK